MKKATKKERLILAFIIFIFSVVSFYTSYTGLLKLAGISNSDYIPKIFMAILVGGLQFALVFSINAFYIRDLFKQYWLKALALLMIYLITMTLSVTFSFSYWYEEFSAEDYANRNAQLQLNKVKESLIEAKDAFASMEQSLSILSNYSETASNREKRFGRTCDPKVGSGEGYFTWLRADDAKYTKSYLNSIRELKDKLDSEIEIVSKYIETFDPKGDVTQFNRVANDKIKEINIKFFQNQTLSNLKEMLIQRSGKNRKNISVTSRRTGETTTVSCIDRDFSIGAYKVIKRIDALKPIEPLDFFDMNDTKRLFSRTIGVLKALIDPSYTIKKTNEMSNPDDITNDDISAVSAGFAIDFIILLFAIYAKKPKEETIPQKIVNDIINGRYPSDILNSLGDFLAEMNRAYLIAIPNDIDSKKLENIKLLMLYMQQHKLAKLYINEVSVDKLNKYFKRSLKENYPNSKFRIYKINKKRFMRFILQNMRVGVKNV
jgi:hypothetical protein